MQLWKIALGTAVFLGPVWGVDQPQLSEDQVNRIIQEFAARETEFSQARENYTYRQTARLQELDEFGNERGRWEMVSDIVFPDGKRFEKVVRAPVSTLRNIGLTPEDEQDLRNVLPFVLTTDQVSQYLVRYLGDQKADEIPCHVFAVKPKTMEPGKRYFTGEIWVDDRDHQIVKSYGRAAGVVKKGTDYQFPKFETYREQIDGKYWFPTYTRADDVLQFQTSSQRIRMTVRYEDYKQFKSETQIKYGDVIDNKEKK
jgi:hypothetical protein